MRNHPYVSENEDCRPLVIETLRFIYDLEMITQRDGEVTTPELARPRVPHEILFAIGGWSGGSPTNFIETYDTRADRWVRVSLCHVGHSMAKWCGPFKTCNSKFSEVKCQRTLITSLGRFC